MRWHNGRTRRSPNPNSEEVLRDCVIYGERSAAHSILARSPNSNKGRIHLRRPNLSLSLFACSKAADHTFRVGGHSLLTSNHREAIRTDFMMFNRCRSIEWYWAGVSSRAFSSAPTDTAATSVSKR